MKKSLALIIGIAIFFSLNPLSLTAKAEGTGGGEVFKEAKSVSDCGGKVFAKPNEGRKNTLRVNCIFLQEPIGGKAGYDLYVSESMENGKETAYTEYKLWTGGNITPPETGPFQAILSYEPGKQWQSSFGLLYNYVGLVYKFLSGIIVGVVVLMVIVGGIQITVSGGDTSKRDAGRDRILQSLAGMVLWFLSSLILYTINPTFFRFL